MNLFMYPFYLLHTNFAFRNSLSVIFHCLEKAMLERMMSLLTTGKKQEFERKYEAFHLHQGQIRKLTGQPRGFLGSSGLSMECCAKI